MSYQEKRTGVTTITGLLVIIAYCIYAFGGKYSNLAATADLKSWAQVMLIFLGINIAATIVIQIIFHILYSISIAVKQTIRDQKPDEDEIEETIESEMVTDERDRLIELKSSRIGFIITSIGFFGSLIALVLDHSPVVMLNILFVSFYASSLLQGGVQFFAYRKGI